MQITSEEEYGTVLVNADLLDEDGTVVSQGSSSVNGVEPGKRYNLRIVYGTVGADLPKKPTCEARLEFASRVP